MNRDDPAIDQQLGYGLVSGKFDIPNENVFSAIGRALTRGGRRKMGGVAPPPKTGRQRSTQELLAEGKAAQPDGKEDEILKAMDEVPPVDGQIDPELGKVPDDPAGLTQKDTSAVIKGYAGIPEDPALKIDDPEAYAKKIVDTQVDQLEARTWERNTNLDYIDNVESIGKVLEQASKVIPKAAHQSLAEVEAAVKAKGAAEVFKDVLTEKPGALTSEQLLAGRQVMITLADKVEEMAQRITNGKATLEDHLSFEKMVNQQVMVQQYMQGKIREAGRALNSMKIVAQTVNSGSIEQIAKGTSPEAIIQMANHVLDMKKAGKSVGETAKAMGEMGLLKKSMAALVNYRNAAILTGFKTHAVNFISNGFYTTIRTLAVKPMAAGVGMVRTLNKAGADRAYLAEAAAEIAGLTQGMGDAITMAVKTLGDGAFKNGGEYISSFGGRKIDEAADAAPLLGDVLPKQMRATGIPQTLNAAQRTTEFMSYGLLTASDEFWKSINYRKSLYSQAVRMAEMEGVEDTAARANDLLNNITKEMHDAAIHEAEVTTFTNREGVSELLNTFADSLIKAGQMFPPIRIVIPFIRTLTALFDRSVKMSPVAPLQEEFWKKIQSGGAEADMAIAELGFGTVMAGLFYWLYQSNMVTGRGPGVDTQEQRNRKAVLESTGWQQNSVKINGTYVSIERGLEPASMPILAMVNYMDQVAYAKDDATAAEIFAGSVFAAAKHFKDNTYMQGIADLMDLLNGRINFQKWSANQGASFSPSLLRDTSQIVEGVKGVERTPYIPSSHAFWEMLDQQLAARIPGGDPLAIKRYWDGTPVVAGGGEALYLYNTISPIRMSRVQGTNGRKYNKSNSELVANGVSVTPPSSEIGVSRDLGIKVDLIEMPDGAALYDKLQEMVGKQRSKAVGAVINSPGYKKASSGPNSWQAAMLERALSVGLEAGKNEFRKWLIENPLKETEYGPEAKLLNPATLKKMISKEKAGVAMEKEIELMTGAGYTTKKSRERLYVPNI